MIKPKIKNFFGKSLGVVVSTSLVLYLLVPIHFASGVGYVTWRSIALSNSNLMTAAPTTLSAAITSIGQTSISVNSSAQYPPPPFVVTIGTAGTEAIEITAVNGNTWTAVRGYLGTPTTTYLINAAVSGPVTASVQFVPATPATSIQAIVIDFCSDSPIYNSTTCFTPSTYMQIGASGAAADAVTGVTGISASLFTTNVAHNTSRNDIIFSNSGTGYVPLTATTLGANITTTIQTTMTVTASTNYPAAVQASPNTWFYTTIASTGETVQVTNVSGTTWTIIRGALGTTAATATSGASLSQPPIAFTFYGISLPSATGALYARIYTFNTYATANTFASATASSGILSSTYATASGANIDSGGIALYITNTLTVSAKVQEYLQFCVYTATGGPVAPCSLSGSTVTLGNSSGILSLSNAYVDSSTRFDVATNAVGYAAVTFTGLPLSNGSQVIENSTLSGTGTVAATSYVSSVGTNQFGLCVATAATQQTGENSGNISFPLSTYTNGGACPTAWATSAVYAGGAYFGLNLANAGSIYGELLAVQKPGSGSTGIISFLGNVAPATLAGSYSTTFNFVASGTY